MACSGKRYIGMTSPWDHEDALHGRLAHDAREHRLATLPRRAPVADAVADPLGAVRRSFASTGVSMRTASTSSSISTTSVMAGSCSAAGRRDDVDGIGDTRRRWKSGRQSGACGGRRIRRPSGPPPGRHPPRDTQARRPLVTIATRPPVGGLRVKRHRNIGRCRRIVSARITRLVKQCVDRRVALQPKCSSVRCLRRATRLWSGPLLEGHDQLLRPIRRAIRPKQQGAPKDSGVRRRQHICQRIVCQVLEQVVAQTSAFCQC